MTFNRPFHSVIAPAAGLSLAVLAGCASSGLSPRETERQNYSSFVYSLYDLPSAQAGAREEVNRPPARLVLPARVAVVQVGEISPPQEFMNKLRGRPDLFSRVEAISGIGASYGKPGRPAAVYGGRYDARFDARRSAAASSAPQPDPVAEDVEKMQNLARDMGMDHLLVLGGTIDHATHGNSLSILDLTIVGAFVVPSKEITAKATAAGALVDLTSGRVVLTASADADKAARTPTATQEGGELNVLRQARDEVVTKLADSLVAECQRRRSVS